MLDRPPDEQVLDAMRAESSQRQEVLEEVSKRGGGRRDCPKEWSSKYQQLLKAQSLVECFLTEAEEVSRDQRREQICRISISQIEKIFEKQVVGQDIFDELSESQ